VTAGRQRGRSVSVVAIAAAMACFAVAPVFAQTSAATAARAAGPGSLAGIWTTFGYKGSARNTPRERAVKTLDGALPPFLPKAAELFEQRMNMATKGQPFINTLAECLPGGVPEMVFGSPYPAQILESPGQVTILYEMYNHFRVIHLNGKHPADPDPTFMGHSIGHWEGATLVVDTVGLNDRTSLDEVGMPHSEALHVIERYRRTDANTLEILVTIDDPETFSKSWDTKVVYKAARPDMGLIEYICENNRSARD
jgi:hypothetical protein